MENKKPAKLLNETYINQINILRALTPETLASSNSGPFPKHLQISDIADRSRVKDEKEVLRYLYILEGQKLVNPVPPGDFTSKTWTLTIDGIRAMKSLDTAVAA